MRKYFRKRHLLIASSLALILAAVAFTCLYTKKSNKEITQVKTGSTSLQINSESANESISIKGTHAYVARLDLNELFIAVNSERIKLNLAPLVRDPLLDKSAVDKCADMVAKNYWAHDSPDGVEPWEFIKKYNQYNQAGENLAEDYSSVGSLVRGWMNSPGHRENIVKPSFENVGYAKCTYRLTSSSFSGNILVVQHLSDNPFN